MSWTLLKQVFHGKCLFWMIYKCGSIMIAYVMLWHLYISDEWLFELHLIYAFELKYHGSWQYLGPYDDVGVSVGCNGGWNSWVYGVGPFTVGEKPYGPCAVGDNDRTARLWWARITISPLVSYLSHWLICYMIMANVCWIMNLRIEFVCGDILEVISITLRDVFDNGHFHQFLHSDDLM